MKIYFEKMDASKITQKNPFWVIWVVFIVLYLCSDSYAVIQFIKKRVITNPVRKNPFPTFLVGNEKWTISRMSFFQNQFTFLENRFF